MERIFGVIDKLISFNEYAFLKGRLLVDGVVVVYELVDVVKNSNKSCFILKWILRKHMTQLVGPF